MIELPLCRWLMVRGNRAGFNVGRLLHWASRVGQGRFGCLSPTRPTSPETDRCSTVQPFSLAPPGPFPRSTVLISFTMRSDLAIPNKVVVCAAIPKCLLQAPTLSQRTRYRSLPTTIFTIPEIHRCPGDMLLLIRRIQARRSMRTQTGGRQIIVEFQTTGP